MASIAQKYYVYDPGVRAGDEVGGCRVHEDKDNGLHILTTQIGARYWIDQGLLGLEPLSKLSGASKKLLGQLTRGRSENTDDEDYKPSRLPKYSKQMQSGAPGFALSTARKPKKPKKEKTAKKAPKQAPPPAA